VLQKFHPAMSNATAIPDAKTVITTDKHKISQMWSELNRVQGNILEQVTWGNTQGSAQLFEILYRLAHSYIWAQGPQAQLAQWPTLAGNSCEKLSEYYEEYSNKTGKWFRILLALRFIPDFQNGVGNLQKTSSPAMWERLIEILDIKFHCLFHMNAMGQAERVCVSDPRDKSGKGKGGGGGGGDKKKHTSAASREEIPAPEYLSVMDFVTSALLWYEL
jgi:hypothetical protein